MRNKIKLLLFILIVLMPCTIKADMGGVVMKPYEMVVTNQEGKDCPTYDGKEVYHMSKDEVFTVKYEYGDKYMIGYEDKDCELTNLNGATLVKDIVDPKEEYKEGEDYYKINMGKYSSKKNALVYATSGVDVKKGPASIYDNVGHLDKGETFKYEYYTDDYVYIDSGKLKGWVNILESKVLVESEEQYIVKTDTKMICTVLPKNTIIKPKYRSDPWTHNSLVEYNGCTDLVDNRFGNLETIYKQKNHSKKELVIYEYINDGGKELAKIPNDADFIILARGGERGEEIDKDYVEYNGIKGWIKCKYTDYEFVEDLENDKNTIENNEEESKEDEERKTISITKPADYVTTYVIIALSLAVIVLILLLLINRKKYKKLANKVEQ